MLDISLAVYIFYAIPNENRLGAFRAIVKFYTTSLRPLMYFKTSECLVVNSSQLQKICAVH